MHFYWARFMVSLLTKLYLLVLGIEQLVFIYEFNNILRNSEFQPLLLINYILGLATILILIAKLFTLLDGYLKYVAIFLIIPIINVFIVPFIVYKLTFSKGLGIVSFLLWFSNLIFTLLSNIPPIIYYGEGSYFLYQFLLLDVTSFSSLLCLGYCLIYAEKKLGVS